MMEEQKLEVKILKDLSEEVPYDKREIPLYIRTRKIGDYVNMRSFPHWHDDIELMYIVDGQLKFNVNGRDILLHSNDCILLNIKQMHHSAAYKQQECTFTSILFHPRLFTGNPIIYKKCVASILKNPDFDYLLFEEDHPFHREVAKFVKDMQECKKDTSFGYDMALLGVMHIFWGRLLQQKQLIPSTETEHADSDLKLLRDMLSFIHNHYMEKLTLDDIARYGNVCRSKCCGIFKEYLHSSPIDFLNQYRLETSCRLLKDTDYNITTIAVNCGFVHNSYYAQQFRKCYGCSPREYRKNSE